MRSLFNLLFGKKLFFRFKKENLHYLPIDDDFMDKFQDLTDCKVYLDEGHVIFDSYQTTRFSMQKRTSILHTRHFNRSIAIISQRPTAVHVSARANVNRFYKCEKIVSIFGFIIFRRSEFQDLEAENVDESDPVSRKYYLGNKRVFDAYNSKYLRGGIPRSQGVYADVFELGFKDRVYVFAFNVLNSILNRLKPVQNAFLESRFFGGKGPPSLGVKSMDATLKNSTGVPSGHVVDLLAHKRSLSAGSTQRIVGEGEEVSLPF